MRKHTLLTLLAFGSITLSGCYVDLGFIKIGKKEEEQQQEKWYDEEKQKKHISEYYSTIDSSLSGQDLIESLMHLNLKKRTSTVGYSDMGTDPSGKYKYTDYDPAYAKYNKDGVAYGTRILSFYSGKSVTKWDREHVWPASRLTGGREGNIVDGDIFMPRPTCSEENQDRGNSVYVTGANDTRTGFDPVTAFKDNIGVAEGIRGECARIIFYCLTIDSSLVLNDNTANERNNMGKVSDLMEWHVDNAVTERERRRQVGGEYLQGNRNAFVDHPEYACKIWGSSTSRTKAACQKAGWATN